MPEKQTSDEPKLKDEKLYIAEELREDKRCAHVFKRRSPYMVECTKCHVGYQDSPDSPFPVEELTEYYANSKNREFYKKLL